MCLSASAGSSGLQLADLLRHLETKGCVVGSTCTKKDDKDKTVFTVDKITLNAVMLKDPKENVEKVVLADVYKKYNFQMPSDVVGEARSI